jgi:hypothetical protein
MLEIRKEQMDEFSKVAAQSFEDQMVTYIKEAFPKAYNDLKEPRIREIIRYEWNKAKGYSLKSERGIRLYISLTFLLGSGFDTDPQLPWAEKILKDEAIIDESEKCDRLYEESINYYYQVAGADGEHIDEAIQRIQNERMEGLSVYTNVSENLSREFVIQTTTRLKRIFPEKYEYLGNDVIDRLISPGIESAKAYGITIERGLTIYIIMMFILGSGFDKDLKYFWTAEILNDKSITNQVQRVDRLYAKAMELIKGRFS